MAAKEQFESLQAKWRLAHEKMSQFAFVLRYKYAETWQAPQAKRERLDRLHKAEDKAMDRVFAWLDKHSPRNFRSGVPAYWVCDQLSYDDAITSGRMAVTPPCGYGSYPSDSVRFAQAIAS